MTSLQAWPLWSLLAAFAAATAVIAVAGPRIARVASRLARLTGLGQAVFGAVWLGGTTSLPGIVASVTAALEGHAELAVSNAVGGIAVQTAFLALADMAHRGANLEHAAASLENLMQGALLATLLAIPLAAMAAPPLAWAGVHPASPLLVVAYLLGLRLATQARAAPLWHPELTRDTRLEEPPPQEGPGGALMRQLWLRFAGLALAVVGAGYVVAQAGIAIAGRTGLSETVVGGLFTAVATSIPELVTAVAAVRQGALALAVGDVIGGNSFDVLFLAFADLAYRPGSIYHAITERQIFVIAVTQLMTGVLLLGLLRRERSGIAGIGFESFLVLVIYLGAAAVLFLP